MSEEASINSQLQCQLKLGWRIDAWECEEIKFFSLARALVLVDFLVPMRSNMILFLNHICQKKKKKVASY